MRVSAAPTGTVDSLATATGRPRCGSSLAAALAAMALSALAAPPGLSQERERGHEHPSTSSDSPRAWKNVTALEALKKAVDPAYARRVTSVRLRGTLDAPAGQPKITVEEVAFWPDRYERQVRQREGLSFSKLSPTSFRFGLNDKEGAGTPQTAAFSRLRLRCLLVLRHLAEAVAAGTPAREVDFGGLKLPGLEVRDGHGPFRIVWGGPLGSLQGIVSEGQKAYFPAYGRTGPWMYPAIQSIEAGGKLQEVLRVVETVPTPEP